MINQIDEQPWVGDYRICRCGRDRNMLDQGVAIQRVIGGQDCAVRVLRQGAAIPPEAEAPRGLDKQDAPVRLYDHVGTGWRRDREPQSVS